jgi:peptidoglycan hydrolase-like protein with peptidoglycan-binding domain
MILARSEIAPGSPPRAVRAPPTNWGSPSVPTLTFKETRASQRLLETRGHDVGRIDGVAGLKSRVAVKETQIKSGLPADGGAAQAGARGEVASGFAAVGIATLARFTPCRLRDRLA